MIDKAKLDLYEVNEYQFKSFQKQLQGRKISSYAEGNESSCLTIYTDDATGIDVLGIQECYDTDGLLIAIHYFIFDLLETEDLSDPPTYQFITVDEATYLNIIKLAAQKAESKKQEKEALNNEENLSASCESAER